MKKEKQSFLMFQGPVFYLVAISLEFPFILNISSVFVVVVFHNPDIFKSTGLIFSKMFLNLSLPIFLDNYIQFMYFGRNSMKKYYVILSTSY